jgi:pimeloyl-ACP methyl ester carboxylesterase
MPILSDLGAWISANESLLSGLAAMIVLAGVVLSPLGVGLRRLAVARSKGEAETPAERSVTARSNGSSGAPSGPATSSDPVPPARLTLKTLTAPSIHSVQFARSGDLRIAYNARGAGPHTLILAPGIISHLNITDNLPSFRGSLDGLARFARVLTFDKRGQGLSDPTMTAPDLEERAEDIAAVMDDAGVDRAVLMGTSEGGPMCLHFAHCHPERVQGLVLLGTTACWVQSSDFPIGLPRPFLERLPQVWGEGVLRDVFFPSLSREQMDDDTYRAFEKLIATRGAIRQLVQMMIETDVRPLLPEIEVPALVIHFAGDLAVPIRLGRALAEALPNAEFMEVNAVDHADLSNAPEAMVRIREFCERVEESEVPVA